MPSAWLMALPLPHTHLEGTLLPRGFFLGLGLIYLAALAVDRLAAHWRLPVAAAVLLLGLVIPSQWLTQAQPLGPLQLETLHRVSLALLIFYAGLKTDLRRIRGMTVAGLRLGCGGVLITVVITALALLLLAPLLAVGLPPAAAVLAVCCLGATDSGAIEDLLVALGHSIRGRLSHLLQFEVAVSTVVTLLGFGLLAGVLQAHPHGDHQALHGLLAVRLMDQLGAVGLHVIAGLLAGLAVGAAAPRLIDALVRSEPMLLLVAVVLAFVAFGFGQLLGGGGLLAVFVAGVLLSNGRYRISRFEQQALGRVMHPLNTAAEITVLLLLGLLVKPAALITVLPLGLALAIVVPLARLLSVSVLLPTGRFPWPDRLVLAGCGLRAAVPLALAVAMTEELPHLRGVASTLAEPLGEQLLALLFVVVLADLLLQPLLMRSLLRFTPETSQP
ncbi:cation:proton antiporter [Vulcanococcus sp. Clear-D1]|uniref:cation:proton antiporter domain-containing protein n=1 Tax=Vulcanococcus sp. Clear-D1 TaxID=2766970 RepID=UPI0019BFB24F|nr:cation:proton antiporter [Vulcanococcus sp. Clear-D1]MBD1192807.1 cation:proton antiporter [Vulcanococcus sp. Clear-D1]